MKFDYTISDDSGFIGIINAAEYNSFVNEDWELDDLTERFVSEMNNNNLVIWNTGFENTARILITDNAESEMFFREFSHFINVTNSKLYLTNYDDLSYSAQYADNKLPLKDNSDLVIPLENGYYKVTVRQLADPEKFDWESDAVDFEVIIEKHDQLQKKQITEIPWWKGF